MKKASLTLSVNAIVILILVITMLGLGLGFINKMFGDVSEQFEEKITQESDPPEASASEQITLSRERIIANSGDRVVLKTSVYNSWGGVAAGGGGASFACADISDAGTGIAGADQMAICNANALRYIEQG